MKWAFLNGACQVAPRPLVCPGVRWEEFISSGKLIKCIIEVRMPSSDSEHSLTAQDRPAQSPLDRSRLTPPLSPSPSSCSVQVVPSL